MSPPSLAGCWVLCLPCRSWERPTRGLCSSGAPLVPGPVSEPGKVVESCPSETSLPADLEHWGSDQNEEGADGADPQAGGSLAERVWEVP